MAESVAFVAGEARPGDYERKMTAIGRSASMLSHTMLVAVRKRSPARPRHGSGPSCLIGTPATWARQDYPSRRRRSCR